MGRAFTILGAEDGDSGCHTYDRRMESTPYHRFPNFLGNGREKLYWRETSTASLVTAHPVPPAPSVGGSLQNWRTVVNQTGPSESSTPQSSPARVIVAALFFVFAAMGVFRYTWMLIIAGLLGVILFLMG